MTECKLDIGTAEVSQPSVSSLPFYSTERTVKGKQDLLRHHRDSLLDRESHPFVEFISVTLK